MCFSDDCDGYDMLGDLAEYERYLRASAYLLDLADTADADMNDGCCDDICDYGDHGFWYI